MSDTLAIGTYGNMVKYRPGEPVAGKAMWILDREARAAEIRLFWYTRGKGTQDVELVDLMKIPAPGLRGEAEFSFALPAEPYSFSGRLISLLWALELVVEPGGRTARCEITVSPTGEEIVLGRDDVAPATQPEPEKTRPRLMRTIKMEQGGTG